MEFRPIAKTFGVEVIGLDPREPLSSEQLATLNKALDEHHLLLVRGYELNSEQQARFGDYFGPAAPAPTMSSGVKREEEQPGMMYVSNVRDDGILPNGELAYHQDSLFEDNVVRMIMLYGVEMPDTGGATKFRSCREIYTNLAPELQEKAKKVQCLHLFDYDNIAVSPPKGEDLTQWENDLGIQKYSPFSLETAPADAPRNWQPLIWTSPKTGEDYAWCVHGTTVDIGGVDRAEGRAIMDAMMDRAAESVEEYHHQWRPGDLVFWNNQTLQHARTPFDPRERRSLRRTSMI
jgi:taurine dioxygenase